MKRRQLLQLLAATGGLSLLRHEAGSAGGSGLASLSATAATAQGAPPQRDLASGGRPQRVIVLVELRGGNDGLNTLGPFQDPTYQRARGPLALGDGLPMARGLFLHPALAPLQPA